MADAKQAALDLLAGAKLAESAVEPGAGVATPLIGWLERVTETVEPVRGMPVIEHAFGVLPTLREFQGRTQDAAALEAIRRGKILASLGLFTPTPEFSWVAAAVPAVADGEKWILTGNVRIGAGPSDWTIVLVHAAEHSQPYRLGLIANNQSGVTRVRSKGNISAPAAQGQWLVLKEAVVESSFLSNPVTLEPGAAYWQTLDAYAGAYAMAATLYAKQLITAVRRTLRVAEHGGKSFNTSQVLAMGTTELEVQIQFSESAVRSYFRMPEKHPARAPGLALAAAASRLFAEASARMRQIAELDASDDYSSNDAGSSPNHLFLGGALLIESELARTLGI